MIFRVKAFYLVLIALTIYSSHAEQIENPYFWKVEKDGKTSYILGAGSLSLSVNELPCSQEIQLHLKNSDLVLLEVDPHSEDFIEAQEQQEQWSLSKDGREFQALNETSQAFFRSRGVSETLNLYGYNARLIQLCQGLEDGKSIYSQVESIARSGEIPIQGLEDYYPARRFIVEANRDKARSYNQLSGVQFLEEIYRLDHSISIFPRICPPAHVVNMIEDYKSGFIVDVMTYTIMRSSPQEMHAFHQRNSQWVRRFEEARQSYERIFVAASLVHFLGPISFMNMIIDKGYTVESVVCAKTIAL